MNDTPDNVVLPFVPQNHTYEVTIRYLEPVELALAVTAPNETAVREGLEREIGSVVQGFEITNVTRISQTELVLN